MYRDESCPIVLQMDGVLRGSVRTPVEKSIARREVLAGGSDVSWKDGGIRILSPDVRFGTTDSPAANRCPCPGALRLEYERHRRKKRSVWKQAFLGQAASLPPRAFSPAAPRLTQARRHAAGAARAASTSPFGFPPSGTQRAKPAPRAVFISGTQRAKPAPRAMRAAPPRRQFAQTGPLSAADARNRPPGRRPAGRRPGKLSGARDGPLSAEKDSPLGAQVSTAESPSTVWRGRAVAIARWSRTGSRSSPEAVGIAASGPSPAAAPAGSRC
jgi:hypothetical protein